MVPTPMLIPRVESLDGRKWKIVGVWKKRETVKEDSTNVPLIAPNPPIHPPRIDEDEEDDDGYRNEYVDDEAEEEDDNDEDMENMRSAFSRRDVPPPPSQNNNPMADTRGRVHDIDIEKGGGMPPLDGDTEDGTDLENVPPVRIEAWMAKVFHYGHDSDVTGENKVFRKVFCILTVTPVRNFNLAEYLRHSIVENTQGTSYPGMSSNASESMRKDRKDMLHRLLLGQMDLCGYFNSPTSNARYV